MTKDQLKQFIAAYAQAAKISQKALDKNGQEIEEQSDWVWFDRQTIEALLSKTDPKTGGLKIYFGQYNKENISLLPDDRSNREDYIGRVSMALVAANQGPKGIEELGDQDDSGSIANGGGLCPPDC